MTDSGSTHKTLDLLAEYNDHRNERDKAIEYIEKKTVIEDSRPSYDDLFKENIKLRLQIKEQATEIESLNKVIDGLRSSKAGDGDILLVTNEGTERGNTSMEVTLPPRSADRKKNTKNLSIPIPDLEISIEKLTQRTPQIDITTDISNEDQESTGREILKKTIVSGSTISPSSSISNRNLDTSQSEASPATSVQYTTSRISIASPHSPRRTAVQARIRSPQSANRVAAVINNQVHSPLRSNLGSGASNGVSETLELTSSPLPPGDISKDSNRSPENFNLASELQEKVTDFSPGSKQNLNSFAEFLDDTFGEEGQDSPLKNIKNVKKDIMKPPPPPSFAAPPGSRGSPNSIGLGSPVILTRKENTDDNDLNTANKSQSLYGRSALPDSKDDVSNKKLNIENIPQNSSAATQASSLQAGPTLEVQRRHGGSIGSAKSLALSLKSDVPLFVQPEEFGSVRIDLLSTLYLEADSITNQYQLLFSVVDRKSDKEMFKFSKTQAQLYEMDSVLRPRLSSFSLPTLPEKSAFDSLMPTKVDYRRERINQYVYALFSIPEFPAQVGLRIAQFMSTDTVTNPMHLGDAVKEGSLLMRRAKALSSGPNWRVRYGVLNGDILLLYDRTQIAERVRLRQSSIELLPNLPEDKYGTRNGFVIIEHKKNGLSSTTRYYLCAETSKERELWVSAVSEYITNPLLPPSSSAGSISTAGDSTSFSKADTLNGSDQVYVTDLTNDTSFSTNTGTSNTSPYDTDETTDYDKESKRLKMRSFFPFKRLATNALGMVYDDGVAEESFDSEAKYSDTSIARSLESMNLNGAIVSSNVVFGSPLERCLELSSQLYQGKYQIPSVVYRCLEFLYKNYGIQEEGIFRLSGSSALIKSLQEQFDREYDIDLCNYNKNIQSNNHTTSGSYVDVNTVSGLLKLYLRKLPHLIVGEDSFNTLKNIVDSNPKNPMQIAIDFRNVVNSGVIPKANISLMYALFELLVRIEEKNSYNKMNLRNLCIVFSPTLNVPVTILEPLILDFDCIFNNGPPVDESEREQLDLHIPQM